MKYGIARLVDIYDIDQEKGEQILTPGGAYLQAQLWSGKHLKDHDENIRGLLETYVWAYFAIKGKNKLQDYNLPEELSEQAIEEMANHILVYLNEVKEDSLPLSTKPVKK